jgi:cardiolipin synthase
MVHEQQAVGADGGGTSRAGAPDDGETEFIDGAAGQRCEGLFGGGGFGEEQRRPMGDGAGESDDGTSRRGQRGDGVIGFRFQRAEAQGVECAGGLFVFLAAGFEDGEGDVFQDGERWQEGAGGKEKAEMFGSQLIDFRGGQAGDLVVAEKNAPAVGRNEESEQVEQQVFSTAVRAADGVEAGFDESRRGVEDLRCAFAPERAGALQMAATEEVRGHCAVWAFCVEQPQIAGRICCLEGAGSARFAAMTLANQITVVRILLIPVFVVFAVYYAASVRSLAPEEWLRWAAVAAFVIAAASDGLDGWIARRFNQRSALGVVLDPIADKGLLVTAIITLSLYPWPVSLPIWFPVMVIARDAVILVGCGLLKFFTGDIEVRPSALGKIATALQMAAVSWVLLQIPREQWVVMAAGLFTLLSGLGYIWRGMNAMGGAARAS